MIQQEQAVADAFNRNFHSFLLGGQHRDAADDCLSSGPQTRDLFHGPVGIGRGGVRLDAGNVPFVQPAHAGCAMQCHDRENSG
ncbi:hypothetical protein [Stenotrophomonas sp. BIGb0135]|uniref:hypothetical protein n=1 Tax=Stenotrophomonas sp. BIGb0135 TaxID=2940620 RepID=UPI0021695991|nr:hypothetical protein [Stenotrophomonas sp. BIGb0135]MCS4235568.1 hypothetical protein [Stenotrophomonas sp. BIGb0135]